ncbi:amidophosphoribosyltransferase [Candidatus Nomurabacteria bacterium]|nr:amidophosphoribosyltransferase [Candidatus Nomurabacteria bacterium]
MENLNEKCAVVGIYADGGQVARHAFFALFALQHRGQEASGITTSDGSNLYTHKGAGLVSGVYTEETIKPLVGHIAIGHNRYSTSGGSALDHAQPVLNVENDFALAHNGNLPSVKALQEFLQSKNALKNDRSDSELIADAIGVYLAEGMNIEESVSKIFPLMTGSFSITMMTKDTLIVIRDSYGMRPLALGKLGSGFVVASETCALKTIGAEFVREVVPGEMLVINKQGLKSVKLAEAIPRHDIFEFVYFARPDSILAGRSVYEVRKQSGITLAEEFTKNADIVVPVPDTAMPVAIGFSQKSGLPLELGLIKNRYVHRTFIEPDQESREHSVALKLIPMPEVLKDKRVIVIDDSIVRGTTSRKLVENLFKAGAKEVHFLISSPPVRFPDFYGIDTPKQSDLIASHKTVEEIREFLGATSLHFLTLDGLIKSIGLPKDQLSTSFFTGEYPIDILERKNEVSYDVPTE